MRKFFPYMMAGLLVSSLSVIACTTTTTTSDDDDDSTSSSGGKTDGGASSSGGNTSSSGGSSSGGSSSSSGGSSSGGTVADFTLDSFTLTPLTGTVDTEATYTWSYQIVGTAPTGDVQAGTLIMSAPDGVTQATLEGKLTGAAPTIDGATVSGTFKFNPPVAGSYKFLGAVLPAGASDPITTSEASAKTIVVAE